jgi:hypothetical protein
MGDSARTVTELYQALRPLILRDVAAAATPATAGGGMEVHSLSGAYHTGTLIEGQAPWASTKGELVAHAALPDVHHATATAGNSGISITGQAISLAAAAAGAGLGYASGVLSVNVADGVCRLSLDKLSLLSGRGHSAVGNAVAALVRFRMIERDVASGRGKLRACRLTAAGHAAWRDLARGE